ncbi:MAG: DUF438 domain-containing protein [Chloroflexi bacterium]|jgi:DUF438 domain-containing protein|nr:DUF438 domain-containing protein [Chloroflexota bacterium]
MSEYINNVSKRKEAIKQIIRLLHEGKTVEELQVEYGHIIAGASAQDIAAAEREVIAEGLPVSEVQKLCDLHVAVFQTGLESDPAPENKPGHPLFDFRVENELIERTLEGLESLVLQFGGGDSAALQTLRENSKNLDLILCHYDKKENMIFPVLEKYGFEGPSKVMWGVDNEIRGAIRQFTGLLETDQPLSITLESRFNELSRKAKDMIYKEEKILIPEALSRFSAADWQQMADEVAGVVNQPALQEMNGFYSAGHTSEIPLKTGALTAEQVDLLLTNLPVDVTFVDENDKVRYFTQGKERIFTRTAAIIGRDVQNCHPPQSVHVVQKIVEDFKAGTRDVAEFWIQSGGAFIHIRYFALRDDAGAYKGVIEVSQNVTRIRALEGEKRLLDS